VAAIYNGGGANGASEAAKERVWIRRVLGEINAESQNTSRLYLLIIWGTISLINNPVFSQKGETYRIDSTSFARDAKRGSWSRVMWLANSKWPT